MADTRTSGCALSSRKASSQWLSSTYKEMRPLVSSSFSSVSLAYECCLAYTWDSCMSHMHVTEQRLWL